VAFFVLFTGHGLFAVVQEAQNARSVIRFLLAVFGLFVDIWWRFGIH